VAAVSCYLDASFLVALLTAEPFSDLADTFVLANPDPLLVSDFASAEFASAIARRVRTRQSTLSDAQKDLSDFDIWAARSARRVDIGPADVAAATAFLRRLDLTLRTPDALHIAIAQGSVPRWLPSISAWLTAPVCSASRLRSPEDCRNLEE
jgi:uncharacterized protein